MNGKLNKLTQKIMYIVNISEVRNSNKPRTFFRKHVAIQYLYIVWDGTENADTLEISIIFMSLNFNTPASSQSLMRFLKVLLTAGTSFEVQLVVKAEFRYCYDTKHISTFCHVVYMSV